METTFILPSPPKTFPAFRLLPSELQILIWKYAFDSWAEGLELYLSTTARWRRTTPDEPGSLMRQKSPLVMTCQLSRSVALGRWEKAEWHESLKEEMIREWHMRGKVMFAECGQQ